MLTFVVDQHAPEEMSETCARLLPGSRVVEYSCLETADSAGPFVFSGASAFGPRRRALARLVEDEQPGPVLNRSSRARARSDVLRELGRRVATLDEAVPGLPLSLRVEHPAANFETPPIMTERELADAANSLIMASYPRDRIEAVRLLPDEDRSRRLRVQRAGASLIGCPAQWMGSAMRCFESAGIEVGTLEAYEQEESLVPWRIDDSAGAVLPLPGETEAYLAGIKEWCSPR